MYNLDITNSISKFDISKHGDVLEQSYFSSIIKLDLPNYAKIWELFIGNNGNNQMLNFKQNKKFTKFDRELFSMRHYTIFESFVCNKIVIDDINTIQISNLGEWLNFKIQIISFFAHIGRIKDMVTDINKDINLNTYKYYDNFIHKFTKLNDLRNIFIHNSTIPIEITSNSTDIPQIGKGQYFWNENKRWNDIKLIRKENAYNYLSQIQSQSINLCDIYLAGIYKEILNYMNLNGFELDLPFDQNAISLNSNTGGTSGVSKSNINYSNSKSSTEGKYGSSGL